MTTYQNNWFPSWTPPKTFHNKNGPLRNIQFGDPVNQLEIQNLLGMLLNLIGQINYVALTLSHKGQVRKIFC